ncbi:MAG: hypothetical protein RIQ89_1372 [Bacteroidota bacterium]|jgi:4-hydroxy-tetrahydrodipicolinate synthase
MAKQFKPTGTGVALVTPFHRDGSIDFKSLKKLVIKCIEGKVDYLVAMGTTGESVTLSQDEKHAVLDFIIEVNEGRLPIVLGMGGNNTRALVNQIEQTDLGNLAAILSVCPYYNKPSQRGIISHYKAIANAAAIPIILYNVPGRTATNMDAQTTIELAHEVKNIIAMKEASGNFDKIQKIIQGKPKDFVLISGDDPITLPLIAAGAEGVISVIANAYPRETSDMVRLCMEGNFDKARKLHYKLFDITNAIFIDGNPAGIKGLLSTMNVCQEYVRLPLMNVSKGTISKFELMSKNLK